MLGIIITLQHATNVDEHEIDLSSCKVAVTDSCPAAAIDVQCCLLCRYGSIARFWGGFRDLSVSVNDPQLLERVDANKLEKRLDGLDFLKGLLGARGIGCAWVLRTLAQKSFYLNLDFWMYWKSRFGKKVHEWSTSQSAQAALALCAVRAAISAEHATSLQQGDPVDSGGLDRDEECKGKCLSRSTIRMHE